MLQVVILVIFDGAWALKQLFIKKIIWWETIKNIVDTKFQ